MKHTLFLISLVLAITFLSCKNDAASKINKTNLEVAKQRDHEIKYDSPIMKFENVEHDFGTINEGDIVETIFKFTNEGKKELIITGARSSCGCTVPEWPRKPILKGETAEIKVKFNSRGKPNKQQKQITLTTNTKNGKELLLIKAFVTPKNQVK
ncbi:MAG: DUF1573 domain-containing protein [Bacteroidota bacterium]